MFLGFPQQFVSSTISDVSDALASTRRSTISTKENFTSCSCPDLTNVSHNSQNEKFVQLLQKGFQDIAEMYRASVESPRLKYRKNKPTLSLLCSYYCGIRNPPEICFNKEFEDLYEENEIDEDSFEKQGF